LQERLNTAHTAVSRTKSSKPHPENRHPPEKASTQLTPLAETRRRLQPPRLPPPHRRTGSAAAAIAQAFACRTSLRWLPASAVPTNFPAVRQFARTEPRAMSLLMPRFSRPAAAAGAG